MVENNVFYEEICNQCKILEKMNISKKTNLQERKLMRKIYIIIKRKIQKIDRFISKYVDHDWFLYNKYDGEQKMIEGIYLIIGFMLGLFFAINSSKRLMKIFFKLTFTKTVDIFNGWYNRVKLVEKREQKELTVDERNELLKNDIIYFMQQTVSKNIIEENIFDK